MQPLAHAAPHLTPSLPDMDAAMAVARDVMAQEAAALASVGRALGTSFAQVLAALHACRGHIAVTGIGKSGHVGRKIAATLASTGAPAFFLHPAEAGHGDLGQLTAGDVVLALSHSGESSEVLRLVPALRAARLPLLGVTGAARSSLVQAADAALVYGPLHEACPANLVPTTSTTTMLALGDAWAMALYHLRGLGPDDYARWHPQGALGRAAQRVRDIMRCGAANPLVRHDAPLREVLAVMSQTPGRPGAAVVVDAEGSLVGLFTDGDLRRLLGEQRLDADAPIADIMHRAPHTVAPEARVADAAALLRQHAIDQLPVVDRAGRPVGLLDVQDVLALS
jgi:arabinose-5-phosphate isomerase